jgi:Dyp-type peroxidase family
MKASNVASSQSGLAYFPAHAIYAAFHLKHGGATERDTWQALARDVEAACARTGYRTVVLRGVGFGLWRAWAEIDGRPLPAGMGDTATLKRHAAAFADTAGDLWFHVKSDSADEAQRVFTLIRDGLAGLVDPAREPMVVPAAKRHDGKVLGGRFTDGLENPADVEDVSARVVVGDDDPAHRGAAFLLAQRFVHDWDKLDAMSEQQKQDMIGRDHRDRILAIDDESSHIKRAREINGERVNARLLRQALPYGHATTESGPRNRANEKGVMFAGYAQSTTVLDAILDSIAGARHGFIQDSLFGVTRGVEGSYWYLPSRAECGLAAQADEAAVGEVTMNPYFDVRSGNGRMFYNARDYQHGIRGSLLVEDCPVSERILTLLNKQFSRWQDSWYKPRETPPLGHLKDHLGPNEQHLLTAPVMLRKGRATQLALSKVMVSPDYAARASLMLIDADELIVGSMPQLSLGVGAQVMEYLSEEERITAWFGMLNEYSATGHNAPDYPLLLANGIDGLVALHRARLALATADAHDFHQAVIWSLEGLAGFIEAHAHKAKSMAAAHGAHTPEHRNLQHIAARLHCIAHEKPAHFIEGLQLVFLTNCALHQIGEPHSIGRLDQQLIGLYEADLASGALTPDAAQEAIDAFWLKMDETVLYNYTHLNDYLTYGTGAVFYSAGNFPQGAAINQWVQQVTVGGVLPNDAGEPQDASNAITLMCLRAARRLPMNAPCLSLRVHSKMQPQLFEEAAKTILSGGAHPVLLNDDKLVPALKDCGGGLTLADARDYTCDGCYEPVIPGRTEWAFAYVPLLPMVDYALNEGCDIQGAGPIHLKGNKLSWNSPPAAEIRSFDHFLDIFHTHWKWAIAGFFHGLVNGYGSLAGVCPSPLFSGLMTDSADTGRDLTDGGARYHFVAPMMCGIADTIDSLYAIRKLVFDPATARCTLPTLLRCLQCDWGHDMKEPFYSSTAGALRLQGDAALFLQLREAALALPKFGVDSDPELVSLASTTIARCVATIHDGLAHPLPAVKQGYDGIQAKYGTPERPFAFTVTPGVGTFEDNVGVGMGMGASANGRRNAQPIAADFTAVPQPPDLPYAVRETQAFTALKDWNLEAIGHGIANAAPSDLNIREDFPLDQLTALIRGFAHGETGSNMVTFTCVDPATYEAAQQFPERYDLVRVRTGGWSEYFVAMFDFHQEYFRRRVYYRA